MDYRKLRKDLKTIGYDITNFKITEYSINSHFYKFIPNFFKDINDIILQKYLIFYKQEFIEIYGDNKVLFEKQKNIIYNSSNFIIPEKFNPKHAYENGFIPFSFLNNLHFLTYNENKKPKELRLDLYQLITDKSIISENSFILRKPLNKYLNKIEIKKVNDILNNIKRIKIEFFI